MTGIISKNPDCICELIRPEDWDEKEINWTDKLFVADHVTSVFHIPLNFGAKMTKNIALIEAAGAAQKPVLTLTDEKSLWGADIYIASAKEVPGAQMAKLSGSFITRVFEGPYGNAGRWAQEMKQYLASKGKTPARIYFFYTACPKCAKRFGKNYVVLFAQV
ncbi:MAG: hypothetical protein M0011_01410 [Elusimicrobia bacterium]|nr:hypothetical protein [Elusimicrobiota bacterium]